MGTLQLYPGMSRINTGLNPHLTPTSKTMPWPHINQGRQGEEQTWCAAPQRWMDAAPMFKKLQGYHHTAVRKQEQAGTALNLQQEFPDTNFPHA